MEKKPIHKELERGPKAEATGAAEHNRTESGKGEPEESFFAKKSLAFIAGILILFGLYLSSLYNYLLFHTLAETFSIVVACGIFIVAWNSRRILDNNYLLFVGIAFLFIGGLDLVHTLAYKGMNVFQGYETNLPTQLWIAARYMESLSLLLAPVFLRRRLRADLVLMAYALSTFLVLGSVFYWHIFPTCFVEGVGLTPFKKISEYVISIILIGAITVLFQKRKEFDERVFQLLVAAMAITIAEEVVFTFYIHAYGFSNLVGHYLKIISFYLIYKAIIETGLVKPYDLLFRNLTKSEKALRDSRNMLQTVLDTIPTAVFWKDRNSIYLGGNRTWLKAAGLKSFESVVGKSDYDLPWEKEQSDSFREDDRKVIESGVPEYNMIEPYLRANGTRAWARTNKAPLRDAESSIIGVLGTYEDITEKMAAEEALQKSEARYRGHFENVSDVIYSIDPEFKVVDVSPSVERVLGYNANELIGRQFQDLNILVPEYMEQAFSDAMRVFKGERIASAVYQFIARDGTIKWGEVSGVPTILDNQVVALTSVARDITKRKELEQEREELVLQLQKALQKLKQLSGLLPICSFCKKIRDDEGYWNQIEAYITEHSEAEFSHGICQECAKKYYPDLDIYDDKDD